MADDDEGFGFFEEDGEAAASTDATSTAEATLRECGAELVVSERVLGEGVSSRVLLGTLDGVEVAVKVVRAGTTGPQADFRAEAALLFTLQHDNIVRMIGLGVPPAPASVVTEALSGGSLEHALFAARDPALDFEWSTKMVLDVVSGLTYLHDKSIIHGDIKAANVALTADRRTAKLTDFGLATVLRAGGASGAAPAAVGGLAGDPLYAAPELAHGAAPTMDADVYSFGLLVWETLTRQRLTVNMRPPPPPPPSQGAGAGAGADEQAGDEESGAAASDEPDWMPPVPEGVASPGVNALLEGCLRTRLQARSSARLAQRAAARINKQARLVVLAQENTAPWVAELPLEIALEIFGVLSPAGVCAVRATCLAWRLLVDAWADQIYRCVIDRYFGGSPGETSPEEYIVTCVKGWQSVKVRAAAAVPWAMSNGHHVLIAELLAAKKMEATGSWRNAPYTFAAASTGNYRLMRALVDAGAAVTGPLLEAAAKRGNMPTMMVLIDAMQSHKGTLADLRELPLAKMMLQAASLGEARMIEWLLSVGASPHPQPGGPGGQNVPLVQAALSGSLAAVDLLLAAGASLEVTIGRSALHAAVDAESLPVVDRLLAAGARVCTVHANGKIEQAVLMATRSAACLPILERLLDAEPAAATWQDDNLHPGPPIYAAAMNGNRPAVDLLLARGATLSPRPDGACAAAALCSHRRFDSRDTARLLGVLEHILSKMTPQEIVAARWAGTPLVALLGQQRFHPWVQHAICLPRLKEAINVVDDNDGSSALHCAMMRSRWSESDERVNTLLDQGATVQRDMHGRTPLFYMSELLKPSTMQRLFAAGDSLTHRGAQGETVLMMSCNMEHFDELVAMGADPAAIDVHGNTVMHHLFMHNGAMRHILFEQLMIKYHLSPTAVNDEGDTPLHVLANHTIQFMLNYWSPRRLLSCMFRRGADPNQANAQGETPLAISRARGLDRLIEGMELYARGEFGLWDEKDENWY